jgi:hypothetical protein
MQTIFWIIFHGFFTLVFGMALLGSIVEKEFLKELGFVAMVIVCLALAGYFLFCIIRNRKWLSMALRLDDALRNDDNGIITMQELANALNYNGNIKQMVDYLMRKNILINCRYDQQDRNKIVCRDVDIDSSVDLRTINCPHCGNVLQGRKNVIIQCPSCGIDIKM